MADATVTPLTDMACLLLHGLERTAGDYDELARRLTEQGALVEALVMPDDGLPPRQSRHFGWPKWTAAAREHLLALAARRDHVVLIGHSLGGVIALHLAAREACVSGIVTLCAPMRISPRLIRLVGILRRVTPNYYKLTEDNGNPVTRRSYRPHWVAWAPLYSLMRSLPSVTEELSQVHCPALIVAARQDHVVPAADGDYLFDHIGSSRKTLVMLERSYHVVLRDVEREHAIELIEEFLASLAPARSAADAEIPRADDLT